jgi:hypothetical protein
MVASGDRSVRLRRCVALIGPAVIFVSALSRFACTATCSAPELSDEHDSNSISVSDEEQNRWKGLTFAVFGVETAKR